MSADNWADCPKCKAKALAKQQELYANADNSYGEVLVEEYLELKKKAETFFPHGDYSEVLREDYGLHIGDDGIFHVVYTADCSKCDFVFVFKESRSAMEDNQDGWRKN